MSIITNTTVISNFATIGRLDLLRQLYDKLHIPAEVYQEIRKGLEEGYRFYQGIDELIYPFVEDGWIILVSASGKEELKHLEMLLRRLDHGEAGCLAIAYHRRWTLLTDDLTARKKANCLGVRISGSIGCLVLAIERRLCTLNEANHLLMQMIDHRYRSPVTDLTPLVEKS
jgi:predicted nucleic acid-binding protein